MAKYLVTGGAGFIGANTVSRLMRDGHDVVVLDNLSRRGVEKNVTWLRRQGKFRLVREDVRDASGVMRIVGRAKPDVIIHLASQTAVTTSVENPVEDFEINAAGTLNVLEAVRKTNPETIFIFASTNKVYGGLSDAAVIKRDGKFGLKNMPGGVPETRLLDFHSPYGCSKGAADQYVRDYHRIYGIPTVVLRQSCIYGLRQFGIEDQGWVAWFTIAGVLGRPITIYGNGNQVRDVLYADDLVDCYLKSIRNIKTVAGRVYNIGGGPDRRMSLAELIGNLEVLLKKKLDVQYTESRPGDQPVYISDISKAALEIGWRPKTSIQQGLRHLVRWVRENRALFEKTY